MKKPLFFREWLINGLEGIDPTWISFCEDFYQGLSIPFSYNSTQEDL